MRILALAIGTAIAIAPASHSTAHAAGLSADLQRGLKLLEPVDRLEQICDYTAMVHIRKASRHFHPDRAVASAMKTPKIGSNSIDATGGAFRSRGHWYAMSYTCVATPDHMQVTAFHLKVGDEIPEREWAKLGLWQ
ncbi:MAG TPA: DUF930 domain-containing protein [Pseudolabrys sp.]|jgi:hypothetical protein|nr:DUF930 domain-containing protein [Pseudolabrys sp.]